MIYSCFPVSDAFPKDKVTQLVNSCILNYKLNLLYFFKFLFNLLLQSNSENLNE